MIALSELRMWLRIDDDQREEDVAIQGLEARAISMVEKYTGHYFGLPHEVTETLHGAGTGVLVLSDAALEADATHTPPILAPTLEEMSGDTWTALDAGDFTADAAMIYKTDGYYTFGRRNWRAVYWTGYDPGEEPLDIKQAVLHLVGHWYQNREAVVPTQRGEVAEMPYQVADLMKPWRKVKV